MGVVNLFLCIIFQRYSLVILQKSRDKRLAQERESQEEEAVEGTLELEVDKQFLSLPIGADIDAVLHKCVQLLAGDIIPLPTNISI